MNEEKTVKEHYQDNIKSCFEPEIDYKETLIALLLNDTEKLDKLRTYVMSCQSQRDAALESIKDMDKEEDILPLVAQLRGVNKDG